MGSHLQSTHLLHIMKVIREDLRTVDGLSMLCVDHGQLLLPEGEKKRGSGGSASVTSAQQQCHTNAAIFEPRAGVRDRHSGQGPIDF